MGRRQSFDPPIQRDGIEVMAHSDDVIDLGEGHRATRYDDHRSVRISMNRHRHPVELRQRLGAQHVFGRAGGDTVSTMQESESVAVQASERVRLERRL